MKRVITLLVLFLFIGGMTEVYSQSWLERLGRRAEEAAKRAVEKNVEEAVDRTVDGAFDKGEEAVKNGTKKKSKKSKKSREVEEEYDDEYADSDEGSEAESDEKSSEGKKQKKQSLEMAYAKSDFVPGDEIIFDDDLSNEQLGEFPSQWDLDEGVAEVVTVGGKKAICLTNGSATIKPLMKNPESYLPDVFTLEMDVYIGDGTLISEDPYRKKQSRYRIYFYTEDGKVHDIDLYDEGESLSWDFYRAGSSNIHGSQKTSEHIKLNDWNHLAFSFNKRAFKGYINGVRIINIPNVQLRPVRFAIWDDYSHHTNDFITNIRLAKGAVPLYDRMMSDGKFITYGITFDVGKSTIKPESMGEINRIVKLMTENPDLKFSVEGHTDSTGSATTNQTLSESRSQAIVDKLVELGIAKDRLTAVGKGQNSPIADNSTDEGRAKNRRVEFVKQ